MPDERPPDWDWVKAIGTCKATVMFGTLKTLAKQNVDTRNAQLETARFLFMEPDGITFTVNRPIPADRYANQIIFKVTDDLSRISVGWARGYRQPTEEFYEVGLDDAGTCKLRREGN